MSPKKSRPTHPGEMLREDFLPDYGLTASGFAKAIGVSLRTVIELIRERRGVSLRMALRLSRLFGTSPEFWLNAQRAVDLWDAMQTNRKMINRIIPLKANERDAMIINRNRRKLNKETHDVLGYQAPISDLDDRRRRLARECAKADPQVEKAFAEEGMGRCPGCRRRGSSDKARSERKRRVGKRRLDY